MFVKSALLHRGSLSSLREFSAFKSVHFKAVARTCINNVDVIEISEKYYVCLYIYMLSMPHIIDKNRAYNDQKKYEHNYRSWACQSKLLV